VFAALLILAVVVGAYLTAARRTEGPPLDPGSTAVDGARAVVELTRTFATMDVLDDVPDAGIDTALVLQDRFDRDAAEALQAWVRDGGTLVVADPGSALTPPVTGAATDEIAADCAVTDLPEIGRLDVGTSRRYEVPAGAETCARSGADAFVVVEAVGAGRVVSIGGPALFTNGLLDEADNAVLATALLAPTPDTRSAFLRPALAVGSGDDGLVDLIGTPVRAALAQLLVAFALMALWRARRLGRPVPEPQPVQIEGAELTRAVGRMLTRAHRPDRAAAVLRDRARRDLSGRLGLPLDAPADLVVSVLAERTGLSPAEARRAAIDPVTTDDDLVAVATLLVRIREEIAHGRRPTPV